MNTYQTSLSMASSAYLSNLGATPATANPGVKATSSVNGPDPAATPTPTSADPTPGAIITLSPGAQLFAAALAALGQTPETSAARVARGQAVVTGETNEADLGRLASKMLGGTSR